MMALFEETQSLCPICLTLLPAHLRAEGDVVYLEKRCPAHGVFSTPVWRGSPAFADWRRPKSPIRTLITQTVRANGCPFDCGLCPEHRQRTCTLIIEVTQRCDLGCPICFADAGASSPDPPPAVLADWFAKAWQAAGGCNIQLSGGEPTMRDDLPELVALGRRHGFGFIQINTNGLRLAREPALARALRAAGADSIFLQFDGTHDAIYRRLRGRPLLEQKRAAIAACAAAGLGVVLVPTVVPGLNTDDIGAILKLGLAHAPTVRAVHFQPISYFGRYPGHPQPPAVDRRITLPELMRAIEEQSAGLFHAADFKPPGCENARCSFHAQYLIDSRGRPQPPLAMGLSPAAPAVASAEEGSARAIAFVARQWAAAPPAPPEPPVGAAAPPDLDDFLRRARARTFAVSAMAFQDVWNLDLERARDCCIHVLTPDGRCIPFCLYNLTGADGRPLYRSQTPWRP